MLYGFLIFLHVLVSIGLVVAVLLQSSKGGGLAGTFGGSGTTGGVFGGRGAAPFMAKATTVFAVLFMITSLALNYVRPNNAPESVLERTMRNGAGSQPAVSTEMPVVPSTDAEDALPSVPVEEPAGDTETE